MTPTSIDAWIRPEDAASVVPLILVDNTDFDAIIKPLGDAVGRSCVANGFRGESGRCLGIAAADGGKSIMLAGCNRRDGLFALASLPVRLPEGDYALDSRGLALDPAQSALGWALGAYRYTRYRKPARGSARLVVDDSVRAQVKSQAEAAYLTRDLINTPTQDMGPADLAEQVRATGRTPCLRTTASGLATTCCADNFPTIHAVGRAARHRAPRLAMLAHGACRRTACGPGRQGRVFRHRRPRSEDR